MPGLLHGNHTWPCTVSLYYVSLYNPLHALPAQLDNLSQMQFASSVDCVACTCVGAYVCNMCVLSILCILVRLAVWCMHPNRCCLCMSLGLSAAHKIVTCAACTPGDWPQQCHCAVLQLCAELYQLLPVAGAMGRGLQRQRHCGPADQQVGAASC